MPHGDVLNTWMLLANEIYSVLQTVRECLSFCFKLIPTMLKLTMSSIVNGLPVVINDEVCDIYFVFSQCFNCFEDFVLSETLAKSVPSA